MRWNKLQIRKVTGSTWSGIDTIRIETHFPILFEIILFYFSPKNCSTEISLNKRFLIEIETNLRQSLNLKFDNNKWNHIARRPCPPVSIARLDKSISNIRWCSNNYYRTFQLL